MSKQRESLFVLGLFLLAMAVAGAFWAVLPAEYRQNQSTDYTFQYEPVARAILAGRGITDTEGALATRYPPGFSVVLAGTWALGGAVGVSEEASLLTLRLLCAGLSAVLLYGLARLVWRAEAALLVGLAWATYPFFLWITKQPNSEVPFIPVFFGALLVFWLAVLRRPRAWWLYLLAGTLAGAAMLIRPSALGLGVVMAVLIPFLARPIRLPARLGLAALLLLGNTLTVLPWLGAAYAETGLVIPLSLGGEVSFKDGLTFLVAHKDYRQEVPVADDVAEMMRTFQRRRTEMKSSGDVFAVVLDEARQDPGTFLKFTLLKAGRSWYGIDSRTFEGPTLAIQAVYFALILWGNAYAFFGRRAAPGGLAGDPGALRRMLIGNWIIVLYFWAMTITVVPLLRYMLPVMGPLFIALPGVYYSLQAFRARRSILVVSG